MEWPPSLVPARADRLPPARTRVRKYRRYSSSQVELQTYMYSCELVIACLDPSIAGAGLLCRGRGVGIKFRSSR